MVAEHLVVHDILEILFLERHLTMHGKGSQNNLKGRIWTETLQLETLCRILFAEYLRYSHTPYRSKLSAKITRLPAAFMSAQFHIRTIRV